MEIEFTRDLRHSFLNNSNKFVYGSNVHQSFGSIALFILRIFDKIESESLTPLFLNFFLLKFFTEFLYKLLTL